MRDPEKLSLFWSVAAALTVSLLAGPVLAGDPAGCGAWSQVRFSPDGRRLLTQDRCEIIVLDTEPLAPRLRIAAGLTMNATFSPDSNELVFIRADPAGSGDQVELWSI